MPSVSAAQHRAMEAAAHGHSTLGIPQKVGKEFVRADDADPITPGSVAAGTVFLAPDGSVLLVLRSDQEANYGGFWALPGGKGDEGETPLECAQRESLEELGEAVEHAWIGEPTVIGERTTTRGFQFTTFLQPVRYRFVPELNAEHSGYAWVNPAKAPTPIHPSVAATMASMVIQEAPALDEAPAGITVPDADAIALDEAPSVRSRDADGRLHVEKTPISKANVCEYYGREIPAAADLGLKPDQKYRLWRHPEELLKAADSFNGLPLLRRHVPHSADDPRTTDTVGSTGTDASFEAPYLTNSIVVWNGDDIASIERDEKKELSSAYRYRADMTPGVTPDGEQYDGIMRDIVGNHVALVVQGRAGPDIVVGDEMPLATAPNSGVPAMAEKKDAEDKKAKDGDMPKPGGGKGDGPGAMDAQGEGLKAMLKEKMGAEDWKAACDSIDDMMKAKAAKDSDPDTEEAEDEEKEDLKEDPEGTNRATDAEPDKEKDDKVDKKAMDEAIDAAVQAERKRGRDLQDAREFVRPYIGGVSTMAMDSADDVYALALRQHKVEIKGVHPSAYRALVSMLPKAGAKPAPKAALAMDAAGGKSFAERFPEAGSLRLNH